MLAPFGFLLLAGLGLYLFYMFRQGYITELKRIARWVGGGSAVIVGGVLMFVGRIGIGSFLAFAGGSLLWRGHFGPVDLRGSEPLKDSLSTVRARYIMMTLDHNSGEMAGRITSGRLSGVDLSALDEHQTRQLLIEMSNDPDSLALFETWLDKYRAGWREYLGEDAQNSAGSSATASVSGEEEAYAILGLGPEATADEINAAHRKLMKSVHPDQGGSTFLATKVNEARDLLLKKHGD